MLGAEIRANYFADLAQHYAKRQKLLTLLTVLLSSSAFATFVGNWLPASWGWLKPALTLIVACVGIASLVEQNQKRVTDAADLHFRWNRVAAKSEALWNEMYSDEAIDRLNTIEEITAELSKSGVTAGFPEDKKRLEKWEDHVVRHRAAFHGLPSPA